MTLHLGDTAPDFEAETTEASSDEGIAGHEEVDPAWCG